MDAPSIIVLARAHQTRERGTVQLRIVVPEDGESEERAIGHDQMGRGHSRLLLLSRDTSAVPSSVRDMSRIETENEMRVL